MASIATALQEVRGRIESSCSRAGRRAGEVRLVAVSKTVGTDRIRRLLDCGHDLLGENRVQEALEKIPVLGPAVRWHLVGHLQRNKARHAVGLFELLHGVDSEKLAVEIDRRAALAGIRQAILLQVNLAREETKSGVDETGLHPLLDTVCALPHLDLRGLMTIPPPAETPERSRKWFARLREVRERCAERSGLVLAELSMGMTDDFEVAIEEGATLVRIGRAIFGERPEH
jgi:pyridoxal phosphate enzyme (YggS family)